MAHAFTVTPQYVPHLVVEVIDWTGDEVFAVDLAESYVHCDSISFQCNTGTGTWAVLSITVSNDGTNFVSPPTAFSCAQSALAHFTSDDLGFRFIRVNMFAVGASSGKVTIIGRERHLG